MKETLLTRAQTDDSGMEPKDKISLNLAISGRYVSPDPFLAPEVTGQYPHFGPEIVSDCLSEFAHFGIPSEPAMERGVPIY